MLVGGAQGSPVSDSEVTLQVETEIEIERWVVELVAVLTTHFILPVF